MRVSNKLVLASSNRHKYLEFKEILIPYAGIELVPAGDVIRNVAKLGESEVHDNYLGNAMAKARTANLGAHFPCIADDSGLEVEALDGKPGIYSRRFATPKSGMAQDAANVEKLLSELKGYPMAKRSAKFVCAVVIVIEGISLHAVGEVEGAIAEAPSGKNGFGYDPVFIPRGMTKTLAELSDSEKNSISHRAKAIHQIMAEVKAKGILFSKP